MSEDAVPGEAGESVPETEPDARAIARRLVRSARYATLATAGKDGMPNASYGAVATLPDGRPLMLLSTLSPHTRNLDRDPRASLVFVDEVPPPGEDPMTAARVTLTGRMETVERRDLARARFLARNPKAELYADFGDFSFRALHVEQVHLVGGFARTARVRPADFLLPPEEAEALLALEADAIAHMNEDHADALALYATRLAGRAEGRWQVVGIDPEGLDLVSPTDVARVVFPEPVTEPGRLRRVLKELADAARAC